MNLEEISLFGASKTQKRPLHSYFINFLPSSPKIYTENVLLIKQRLCKVVDIRKSYPTKTSVGVDFGQLLRQQLLVIFELVYTDCRQFFVQLELGFG